MYRSRTPNIGCACLYRSGKCRVNPLRTFVQFICIIQEVYVQQNHVIPKDLVWCNLFPSPFFRLRFIGTTSGMDLTMS